MGIGKALFAELGRTALAKVHNYETPLLLY